MLGIAELTKKAVTRIDFKINYILENQGFILNLSLGAQQLRTVYLGVKYRTTCTAYYTASKLYRLNYSIKNTAGIFRFIFPVF